MPKIYQALALFCLIFSVETALNDPIFHTILDACLPRERANDKEIFVTLEDVMKENCLDHVTTLWGLDEKTIEGDFKAVDTDEDGKLTLEEGMKVYEYSREVMASSEVLCVYDCCYATSPPKCGVEYKHGPVDLTNTKYTTYTITTQNDQYNIVQSRNGCETIIALMQGGATISELSNGWCTGLGLGLGCYARYGVPIASCTLKDTISCTEVDGCEMKR